MKSIIVVIALGVCAAGDLYASEYRDLENIAAESAQETSLGLGELGKEKETPGRRVFRRLMDDARPFWGDSSLNLKIRAFDFNRKDGDGGKVSDSLAIGSELTFQSGLLRERWSVEATWHTSTGIDAPIEFGGSGLLLPNQDDISVISRANVQYDFSDTWSAKLYRQDFNIPFINRQDSRMIPTTHEGYVARRSADDFSLIAGHITKIKRLDSDEFISMGEAAGVAGDDTGTSVLGAQSSVTPEIGIGAVVQHTADFFTTLYAESSYKKSLSEAWGLQLAAQLATQKSDGDALAGSFDTGFWGLRGAISYQGAILTLAHTETDSDAGIRLPFGGTPSFTSSMISDFDRAGERATRVGLSQNFETYGLPGVSLAVNYTGSSGARSLSGVRQPDADEIDVTVDYRPPDNWLRGVWLRARWGDLDLGANEISRRDLRIILNFTLEALQ